MTTGERSFCLNCCLEVYLRADGEWAHEVTGERHCYDDVAPPQHQRLLAEPDRDPVEDDPTGIEAEVQAS